MTTCTAKPTSLANTFQGGPIWASFDMDNTCRFGITPVKYHWSVTHISKPAVTLMRRYCSCNRTQTSKVWLQPWRLPLSLSNIEYWVPVFKMFNSKLFTLFSLGTLQRRYPCLVCEVLEECRASSASPDPHIIATPSTPKHISAESWLVPGGANRSG